MSSRRFQIVFLTTAVLSITCGSFGNDRSPDRWITVTGQSARKGLAAKDDAIQHALRAAVEKACGTFIKSQSEVKNYQAIYDKILADTVGYVVKYDVIKVWKKGNVTNARVKALVSTRKFQRSWARIAHTVSRKGNPRVVVYILEDDNIKDSVGAKSHGIVQGAIEQYFLKRGIQLMDRAEARRMKNRDLELAIADDDINRIAAVGAALDADVVITGRIEALRARTFKLSGRTMAQWTARFSVRAVQTDSSQLLLSRAYSISVNTTQLTGGGGKVLAKAAKKCPKPLLTDLIEAWRGHVQNRQVVRLGLSGANRRYFKQLARWLRKQRDVTAVNLRELVRGNARIEITWAGNLELFADLIESEDCPLDIEITEQTKNRLIGEIIGQR